MATDKDAAVDDNGTPEEIEAKILTLRAEQAAKRQETASEEERKAKERQDNIYWIAIRGVGASAAEVREETIAFVEKLKADGHEVHYAGFGRGAPGHSEPETFHE